MLVLAAMLGGLILAGVFDPPLNGTTVRERPLTPQLIIPAAAHTLTSLDESLPATNYSVRLTAAYQSGETDIGYGLRLGDAGRGLRVKVSPLGYAQVMVGATAVLPWQPWPHVHTGATPNEIWVNVGGVEGNGRVAVRLNRELLWAGPARLVAGPVGLVGESYGETAVVEWQKLTIDN